MNWDQVAPGQIFQQFHEGQDTAFIKIAKSGALIVKTDMVYIFDPDEQVQPWTLGVDLVLTEEATGPALPPLRPIIPRNSARFKIQRKDPARGVQRRRPDTSGRDAQ